MAATESGGAKWEVKAFINIKGVEVEIEILRPETQKAIFELLGEEIRIALFELKLERDIETVREHITLDFAVKANQIYGEIRKYDDEFFSQIACLYQLGIMEGKRQDMARRKRTGEAA